MIIFMFFKFLEQFQMRNNLPREPSVSDTEIDSLKMTHILVSEPSERVFDLTIFLRLEAMYH